MRDTELWILRTGLRAPEPVTARGPVRLSGAGIAPVDPRQPLPADRPCLLPVRSTSRVDLAAVLLVPDRIDEPIARDGIREAAGLHLIAHAERLDVGELTLWVSVQGAPEHTVYDPAAHGVDRFCVRTRARLQLGDPVVVCPGSPSVACGQLYAAAAWQGELPCHHCGYDPRTPAWHPPAPDSRRTVDALLDLPRKQRHRAS